MHVYSTTDSLDHRDRFTKSDCSMISSKVLVTRQNVTIRLYVQAVNALPIVGIQSIHYLIDIVGMTNMSPRFKGRKHFDIY